MVSLLNGFCAPLCECRGLLDFEKVFVVFELQINNFLFEGSFGTSNVFLSSYNSFVGFIRSTTFSLRIFPKFSTIVSGVIDLPLRSSTSLSGFSTSTVILFMPYSRVLVFFTDYGIVLDIGFLGVLDFLYPCALVWTFALLRMNISLCRLESPAPWYLFC